MTALQDVRYAELSQTAFSRLISTYIAAEEERNRVEGTKTLSASGARDGCPGALK